MNVGGTLPAGWRWTTMGEIADVVGGGTPRTSDPENFEGGSIAWLTPADLSGYSEKYVSRGNRFITERGLESSSARLLPEGAVMFTSRAPIGYVAIARNPISTNQGFKSFVLKPGVLPDYVYWWLKGAKQLAESMASGTTFLELSGAKAKQLPIPIAPIEDQRRIVAEIEKQFSRLDEAVANLKRVKANIKRYKAAVLKAAVEGRLVPTEAELARRECRDYETAERRLGRALARREKLAGTGVRSRKRTEIEESAFPTKPPGWTWATPDQLSAPEANSICAGPFGTIFKAKDFRSEGVPIIFLRHVASGRYLTHKPGFMDRAKWNELFRSYSAYGGELLITKLGEPPGVCAIYPEGIGPAMVTPDVIKLAVNTEIAMPKYLMHYFNSEYARRFATGAAFGTTRQRLTLPLFKAMPVLLPPLAEQQRIVEEVDFRFTLSDKFEAEITATELRSANLRTATLAAAFSC